MGWQSSGRRRSEQNLLEMVHDVSGWVGLLQWLHYEEKVVLMEENYLTNSTTCFYCELCKHKSDSSLALHGHMSLYHNPLVPHTGKWEDNKCHICNTTFNNTFHFKKHLIEEHGFSDLSNTCMNCESPDVGLYRAMPFQAVCMNCKSCELYEANL